MRVHRQLTGLPSLPQERVALTVSNLVHALHSTTTQDFVPALGSVYHGIVTTYNKRGARLFLVPASYDSLLNTSTEAKQVKGRSPHQPAANDGLDWAVQDALDDYDAWADTESAELADAQAVAAAGATNAHGISKASGQSADHMAGFTAPT